MKKVVLTPDAASGTPPKETEAQTIQRMAAENAELKGQLKKYMNTEIQRAADEKVIIEKMAHGLSRQQAMNVIRRQRDFDAAQEKSKVRSPKSKVEPTKKAGDDVRSLTTRR